MTRWSLLVLGIVLIGVSFGSGVVENRRFETERNDEAATRRAADGARVVEERFRATASALLFTAQNPSVRQLVDATNSGADLSDDVATDLGSALLYLGKLYPTTLVDAGIIGTSGTEIAGITNGHISRPDQLSSDERSKPFYRFATAMGLGGVFHSAPYLDDDTGEWVISSSTPVSFASGRRTVLHLELKLTAFTDGLGATRTPALRVVDRTTGAAPGSSEPNSWSVAGGETGFVVTDGERFMFHRIAGGGGNANSWAVVSPVLGGSQDWHGFGAAQLLGVAAALFVLAFAVSGWRSYHRRLSAAAVTDALTGLPNRAMLFDRIAQGVRLCLRNDTQCAVMLIDLDHFKEINDTMGHRHGDRLLVEVARRFTEAVRDSDTLARLGGDEFAVFLPDTNDPRPVASRLLASLHEPFRIDGLTVKLGASIGGAVFPADGGDADTLLQHADVAMYEAKREHRGFTQYRSDRDLNTERRLALAGELGDAIAAKALVVHYQPKIDLGSGRHAGVEALVRWQHPELGLIPPDEFISIAENTGHIDALTMHVLDAALRQHVEWREQGVTQHIAVNLSGRSLLDPELPAMVGELLGRHGVSGDALTLEITETAMISDLEVASGIITALHELGIELSIDDFGTGYFSLSGLRELPIDEIKIDRSFVSSMSSEEKDAFIVRSTITLGKSLGLRVVAEGVEDVATARELRDLGCDQAQGFLMSRPLPGDQILAWQQEWTARRSPSGSPVH